jgi:hypothetical protein
MRLEGLDKLKKKSNDLIGNRTRDLPACSIVPQPTTLPRAPFVNTFIPSDWLIARDLITELRLPIPFTFIHNSISALYPPPTALSQQIRQLQFIRQNPRKEKIMYIYC